MVRSPRKISPFRERALREERKSGFYLMQVRVIASEAMLPDAVWWRPRCAAIMHARDSSFSLAGIFGQDPLPLGDERFASVGEEVKPV